MCRLSPPPPPPQIPLQIREGVEYLRGGVFEGWGGAAGTLPYMGG